MSLTKKQIKQLRDGFESSQGHDLRLTDEAINAIVGTPAWAELEADDDGEEKQMALLLKAEDAYKGIAVSDPGISGMVAKMDAEFTEALTIGIEATRRNKANRVFMYAEFKRVYSKDQLDACPYPGTDADDVKGTNYKPDIVEKPAISGGKIRTVFTNDLCFAHPLGKQYQTDIDEAGRMLKSEDAGVARFKGKSKKALKEIIATATQDRNAMRNMIRGALELHHKLSAIEGMPFVKYEWIQGYNKDKCALLPTSYGAKDGKGMLVSLSPKPLWFMPVNKDTKKEMASEGRDFSVSQVLAFDPLKALKMPEGGTLAELVATAKPEPQTPKQLGEKMSVEDLDNAIMVAYAKLSNTEERAALRKRTLEPDNDATRDAYCGLYLILKPYFKANAKWYGERIGMDDEQLEKAVA